MDHTLIAERVSAAQAILKADGFTEASVTIEFIEWPYMSLRAARSRVIVDLRLSIHRLLFESFDTIEMALDAIDVAIRDRPHTWTKDDVAATLGLPITLLCSICDERPATHDLHDNTYVELTGPSERVCEPCLDAQQDREIERAMEG